MKKLSEMMSREIIEVEYDEIIEILEDKNLLHQMKEFILDVNSFGLLNLH